MNFKRIGRILICLLLVCALLINISPIKAKADVVSGGLVAVGATLVSVPVAVWAAAALIAIGVTVDWVADPNYNSYDALVDNVSTFLTNTGTYVKDGMVDMIRVVDETGKAVFYAAGDVMEAVRTWLFDSGVVRSNEFAPSTDVASISDFLELCKAAPYAVYVVGIGYGYSTYPLSLVDGRIVTSTGGYFVQWHLNANSASSYLVFRFQV